MRIRRRTIVVVTIALFQLVGFVGGVIWLEHSLRRWTAATVQEQVLGDNRLIADQFVRLIDALEIESITPASPGWKRLQELVEQIQLPNNGFVCVTEQESGRLVCHPQLRSHPEMAQLRPGQALLHGAGKPHKILEAATADESEGLTGYAHMPDGTHLIAAQQFRSLPAIISVHQAQESIDIAIAKTLAPLRPLGLTIGIFAAALVVLSGYVALRRYDEHMLKLNENLEREVQQRTNSLRNTRDAIVFALAKLAESRDTDTGMHLDRIQRYVLRLSTFLSRFNPELDSDRLCDLALASTLHDIGKVGVPDAILLKPGPLDAAERQVMETHAAVGGNCLRAIQDKLGEDDFLELATQIAYGHHERWDGAGYPAGLAGSHIPLPARIVALADVYDALTSIRPYKAAMSHAQARKIILKGRGTHFDPQIVDVFLELESEFNAIRVQFGDDDGSDCGPPSSGYTESPPELAVLV